MEYAPISLARIGSMDSYRRPTAGAARTGLSALAATFLVLPAAIAAQEPAVAEGSGVVAVETAAPSSQTPEGFLFRPPVVRIGMRAGFNFARAASGVFDLATEELTLNRSDFGGFTIGADVAIRAADEVDIVLSATHISSSARSEFREWEDQDGFPITQRTTFSQTPLTASARFYLTPRGRQIGRFAWVPRKFAPYVGGGGGAIYYQFKQNGSFVDFVDLSIFDATLQSTGWAPVAMANAGADLSLNPRVTLNTDVRYHWASAEMTGSFTDITDDIDLNGFQLSVGVHFRF
jgi:outer membrane protein W